MEEILGIHGDRRVTTVNYDTCPEKDRVAPLLYNSTVPYPGSRTTVRNQKGGAQNVYALTAVVLQEQSYGSGYPID